MAFIDPDNHTYDDYVRLARRLKHDGQPVAYEDVRVGSDYLYMVDGPRIIAATDRGMFGMVDTGGPITGGWTNKGQQAFRGGRDGIMALADHQEAELRRRQRKGLLHG